MTVTEIIERRKSTADLPHTLRSFVRRPDENVTLVRTRKSAGFSALDGEAIPIAAMNDIPVEQVDASERYAIGIKVGVPAKNSEGA